MMKRIHVRPTVRARRAKSTHAKFVTRRELRLEALESRHLLSVALLFANRQTAPAPTGGPLPPDPVHEIHGLAWHDIDGDGFRAPIEPALADRTIYLDANRNGHLDLGETRTTTLADNPGSPGDETGEFAFTDLAPGVYHVRQAPRAGWETSATAEPFVVALGGGGLDTLRTTLDARYSEITGLIANRHNFTEGNTGTMIVDGGGDMYDGGNILTTNLVPEIPYTGGAIMPGDDMFGPGSRYFTAKYPGLFVMGAENTSLHHFAIVGATGTNGSGAVEGFEYVTTVNGQTYKVFNKRLGGTADPSINHIIILPGDIGSHDFPINSALDDHRIDNIANDGAIYYLLFSRQAGGFVPDETFNSVAHAFLSQLPRHGVSVNEIDFASRAIGKIDGNVWYDVDEDDVRDDNEPGLAGWTVYIDSNGNGQLDAAEPSSSTDPNGDFLFTGAPADTQSLRVAPQPGWAGTGDGDLRHVRVGRVDLTATLANIDLDHVAIAAAVPNRYGFHEGSAGKEIIDGGQNMYDTGNRLGTNLAGSIPYTNHAIVPGDSLFGPGSSYFTSKYPGLFLAGVANMSIDRFEITGRTGTGGAGRVVAATLPLRVADQDYTLFVKQIVEAATPSIIHVIIVKGDGSGIQHDFSAATDDDSHSISGLTGMPDLYYLLASRHDGLALADGDLRRMVEPLLSGIALTNLEVSGLNFGQRGAGSISGAKWYDVDRDGIRETGEPVLAGWTMYLDTDNDGILDVGEPTAQTRADDPATLEIEETGEYSFEHLIPGPYTVREIRQPGWQQRSPADAHQVILGSVSLTNLLANLDAGNAAITAQVPNRFSFTDGETGTNINDGGGNMYDGGNFLHAGIDGDIPYSSRTIIAGDNRFGLGSRYFTAKYPGLFVLAASDISIDFFQVGGDLGANGNGQADAAQFISTAAGRPFTVFVKRVFGATVPSVNHLIFVPGDGANLLQNHAGNTNDDFHRIENLDSAAEIYYLLVASQSGGYLTDTDVHAVADEFLSIMPPPSVNVTGIDFGNVRVGEIRGAVWRDLDRDGSRDVGEPGLTDFTVYIDANSNNQFDTGEISATSLADDPVTTDLDETGVYALVDVPAGTHRVREVLPSGWTQTWPVGSYNVTLVLDDMNPGGNLVEEIDFGNSADGVIDGTKWNDLDGDGVRDASEPGLAGFTIYVDENNDSVHQPNEPSAVSAADNSATTEVDETGRYRITDVPPGLYSVREVGQPGWHQRYPDDAHVIAIGETSIEGLLLSLNANFASITALVPSRFDFSEGENGVAIDDGGGDMYDGGNILNTNRSNQIPYSNRNVVPADTFFGPGSRYMTAKYPGLFLMAASQISINEFRIEGNAGADGGGNHDGAVLPLTVNSRPYTLYVRRIFNAGDPSINQIVIVPGTGVGVSHSFPPGTDSDNHTITGLQGVTELYYLLVARTGGARLGDPDAIAIARQFVTQIPSAGTSVADIHFGNLRVGEIHGAVWRDLNRNGAREAGEPGLPGFQLYLDANNNSQFDANETSTTSAADNSATTDVDESGTYEFLNIALATHTVRQVLPAAWALTFPAGAHTVTLTDDQPGSDIARGIDFGNVPDGRIAGLKFNDLDTDGVRDADEPGLAGWTIFLDQNNDGVFQASEPSAVTAVDDPATTDVVETGHYRFGDLLPGQYRVREVPQAGWQQSLPNVHLVAIGSSNMEGLLTNLDTNNASIAALIPNRHDFSGGETGTSINDGGSHMYHTANALLTNRAVPPIPYTNRAIQSNHASFGPESSYFTAKYQGLFLLAASKISIDTFTVTGETGMHGNGQADGAVLSLAAGGRLYTLFVKRTYNADNPSINHIIIVPGNGAGVSHAFPPLTDRDDHTVSGLANVSELYYLLVSRWNGSSGQSLGDDDVLAVAQQFLTQLPTVGTSIEGVNFGNRQPTAAAEIRGVAWHDASNDGIRDSGEPLLSGWTVYLDTDGNGQLDDGELRTVTAADDPVTLGIDETGVYTFTGLAAGNYRVLQVDQPEWIPTAPPAAGSGRREYEVVVVAGAVAGNRDFGNRVPAADIEVRGAGQVIDDGDTVPSGASDTNFGQVELGGDYIEHTFTIANTGETALNLTGNPLVRVTGPHAADFTIVSAPPISALPPSAIARFTVRFTPSAAGARSAGIEIASDDVDEGLYDFAVSGFGFMPSVRAVDDVFTDAVEDTPYITVAAGANNVIPLRATGWDINDELLTTVGQYPTDSASRSWAARDYDVTTSVIGATPSVWDRNLTAPFDCTAPNCTGLTNALTAPKTNVHVPPGSEMSFLARRTFTLDAAQAAAGSATILYTCDSGCMFYINGVFAGASPSMQFFSPFPGPAAQADFQGDEDLPHDSINVDFASRGIQLFAGNNVFAVETHNDGPGSSDIGFDAALAINQTLSGLLLNDDVSGAVGGYNVLLESQPVDELTGAPAGTVQIADNSGNFTFTPLANYTGRARFDYRLVDANSFSIGRAVVHVAPRNDPPVAVADTYTVETTRPFVVSTRGEPLVEANDHRWYYSDDGSDQDTQNPAWKLGPEAAFDPFVAGWKGPHLSQLGFSNGEENDERTLINDAGPTTGALTYYFFTRFDAPTLPPQLVLELKRDDGAAVYINGVEVVTDNLPLPHPYNVGALGNAVDDGQVFISYVLDTASLNLLESDNTLAVEIHQLNAASSDISFDLRLFDPSLGLLGNDDDIDDPPSSLRATLVSNPIDPVAQGTLVFNSDGTFRFTPAQPQVGSASFSYRTQDAAGAISAAVTVTLNLVNNDSGPVQAADDTGIPQFITSEDVPLVINATTGPVGTIGVGLLANDSHPGDESDAVTLILASPPASGGSVVFDPTNNGGFTYIPGQNLHGTDTFAYQVDDGGTLSNVATVQILILSVDDAPVANDDQYAVIAGSTLDIGIGVGLILNDTDAEGDDLELVELVPTSGPEFGELMLNPDGSFTYMPDSGFLGDDTFAYTVRANGLTSEPATVTISVLAASTPLADLNGDGRVDLADLAILSQDFGTTGEAVRSDLNADGRVGLRDLILLRNLIDEPHPDLRTPGAPAVAWSRADVLDISDRAPLASHRHRATIRRVAFNPAAHEQAFAELTADPTIRSTRRTRDR